MTLCGCVCVSHRKQVFQNKTSSKSSFFMYSHFSIHPCIYIHTYIYVFIVMFLRASGSSGTTTLNVLHFS